MWKPIETAPKDRLIIGALITDEVQLSDYLTERRTVLRSRWELWKPWTAKVATRIIEVPSPFVHQFGNRLLMHPQTWERLQRATARQPRIFTVKP